MKPSREEEYQRALGFPASILSWRSGQPEGRHTDRGVVAAFLSHPVLWIRWRRAVARRGPYTPEFPEFCRERVRRT